MSYKNDLRKSLQTLKAMIEKRSTHNERYRDSRIHNISEEELANMATQQVFSIDICEKVRLIYNLAPKYKFVDIKKYVDELADMTYILILKDKLTGTTVKSIANIPDIQVFELRELMFNIMEHVLVPHHDVIVDEHVIQTMLKSYHLKSKLQLPLILKTDPVARFLALKPGNIVRITRPSPSAGEYIFYRCCT